MEFEELLTNYREQIDSLDKELLYLLSRRFVIVKQIGVLKNGNNIPILQKNRWEALLNENIEVWMELWLSRDIVEDIWNRIHAESLKIEKKIWQIN